MKKIISALLVALMIVSLTGCSDDTDIDMFGLYENVLPEELKNVNPDELTQEQILQIIDNLSVDKDIKQMEGYLGFSFMDFMKQIAENPIDESLLKSNSNYMSFQEAAEVLKQYNFDINALDLEHPENMTLDQITKAVTGYSIKKGFASWGPGGVEIYNTMENMYHDIINDTKDSVTGAYDAFKNAIGKKTDKEGSEVTEQDILDYIQSELMKNGYTKEGSSKVMQETLDAVAEELDTDQSRVLRIFISAAEGALDIDTDLEDTDITDEEREKAKDMLNRMLDEVSKELTSEELEVFNMFRDTGKFLASYNYKSGSAKEFTDGILDSISKAMNMTQDQKELIEIIKSML